MEPIVFQMHPRLGDYRESYRVMQPRGPYYVTACLLCLAIFATVIHNGIDRALAGYLAATALLLALYFGNYAYAIYFKLPQRAFEMHGKQVPLSYRFDESALSLLTADTSTVTSWRAFARFVETASTIVIVHPGALFYIIPKRDIPSDRLDDLRSLLARKIAT